MKTAIIYKSVHNKNTQKIAEIIAKELNAQLFELNEISPENAKKYDLIGFGSGIYFSSHHKDLLKFVKKIPKQKKKCFIFSTAGFPLLCSYFHKKLKKELVKKGFRIIGDFSCKGYDNYGPFKLLGGINKNRPNKKDFDKARKFVKNIK